MNEEAHNAPSEQGGDAGHEQPLLRLLVEEAQRRGDTLVNLAHHLGVSYARLAQWRRGEAMIAGARPAVMRQAAAYLGAPTVAILALADQIHPEDFLAPGAGSLEARARKELEALRRDPMLAGFVPDTVLSADLKVQLLIVLLYREVCGGWQSRERVFEWARVLRLVSAGDAQAIAELARLRGHANEAG